MILLLMRTSVVINKKYRQVTSYQPNANFMMEVNIISRDGLNTYFLNYISKYLDVEINDLYNE